MRSFDYTQDDEGTGTIEILKLVQDDMAGESRMMGLVKSRRTYAGLTWIFLTLS